MKERIQYAGDKRPDRKEHVWVKMPTGGLFKCVICGGLTKRPCNDAEIITYDFLTPEERALCPKLN